MKPRRAGRALFGALLLLACDESPPPVRPASPLVCRELPPAGGSTDERPLGSEGLEIMAFTTRTTLPPARKCASSSFTVISIPAFTALMRAVITVFGGMRRRRIATSVNSPT
jgi:hypothetical protein